MSLYNYTQIIILHVVFPSFYTFSYPFSNIQLPSYFIPSSISQPKDIYNRYLHPTLPSSLYLITSIPYLYHPTYSLSQNESLSVFYFQYCLVLANRHFGILAFSRLSLRIPFNFSTNIKYSLIFLNQ